MVNLAEAQVHRILQRISKPLTVLGTSNMQDPLKLFAFLFLILFILSLAMDGGETHLVFES